MPSTPLDKTECIAFINNPISGRMLQATLRAERVDPAKSVLFVLRALRRENWWSNFAHTVVYPHKASLSIFGQIRFIPFYWHASRILRSALQSPSLRHLFVVNNDNILTNHALLTTKSKPECHTAVISEGLMNYQDIQLVNRAKWRNQLRPLIARSLGLRWSPPCGHLSGAFEEHVKTVYGFSEVGIFAPQEKVCVFPLESIAPSLPPEPQTILFLETAIWQWMDDQKFRDFANRFVDWLNQLGSHRLLIKPHPNYPPSPYLRSMLGDFEILEDSGSVEEIAGSITASRVVGFCCTGLVTLAILRPDLQCIDFGHDFYFQHAYRGDRSLLELMASVGIQLVTFEDQRVVSPC